LGAGGRRFKSCHLDIELRNPPSDRFLEEKLNLISTLSLDFTLLYNVCFTIIFYIEGGFNQWKK